MTSTVTWSFSFNMVGRTVFQEDFSPMGINVGGYAGDGYVSERHCAGLIVDVGLTGSPDGPDCILRIRSGATKGWTGSCHLDQIEILHPLEFLAQESSSGPE